MKTTYEGFIVPSVFDRKFNLIHYETKSSYFYLCDILIEGPIEGDK